MRRLSAIILFALALACAPALPARQDSASPEAVAVPGVAPVVYDVRVIAEYPHDSAAFTQGLLWHDGTLYESTGRIGTSEIRKVDLETGEVLARRPIPDGQFGEGMALWNDELVSLTWRSGVVHRWRLADLAPVRSDAGYPYEGWGITPFGDGLIASDGSATLRVLDPETYAVRREIDVTLDGRPLAMLNELEMIDGLVFANVWMTAFIVAIDPADGTVRRIIDLRALPETAGAEQDAVLNGIAWDPARRRLFVTGKLWPSLYEVELVPRPPPAP